MTKRTIMGKIHKLTKEVSQKIAAGEVIERPFSVVKELVENSLDAEATAIKVDLLEGGKGLIRVTDNGSGMNREDALACFESHATSKISSAEDLTRISSLGFRGEALASISAVSRITLKTSDGQESQGSLVKREGEEFHKIEDIAYFSGTCIEVKDLFFNLPARKKFLSSDRSELTRIVKYLTYTALAFPKVRVSLFHGSRQMFDYPSVAGLKERIYQIYGKSHLEKLMEIDFTEGDIRIYGFVSRPPSGRGDRRLQIFFVNTRIIKDNTLQAAINQVFRNFLEKHQFAQAFIFLDIPVSEVDINVHPTKAEVRFKDTGLIFRLVYRSLEHSLLSELGVKEVYPSQQTEVKKSQTIQEIPNTPFSGVLENRIIYAQELFPLDIKAKETGPQVLGQYLSMYIVAADEEGIMIIDQHNAHERVLFDKYHEIDKGQNWPRKLALHPLLFEFSPSQILSFEENQTLLEETGFRVEAMGGRSFVLKEYPDVFQESEALEILTTLLGDMKTTKLEDKKKKLLASMACKTAIKAGEPLYLDKMTYLVEELFTTKNSSLCPHGRPIIVRLNRSDIEKGLKRTRN